MLEHRQRQHRPGRSGPLSGAKGTRLRSRGLAVTLATALLASGCTDASMVDPSDAGEYPWHTDIVAATFWIGEVYDPEAADGSQVYSTYDADWEAHYGGCDGVDTPEGCFTERRSAENGYFPQNMVPLENPFYLDLPFDDLNHPEAFARRGTTIPWAAEEAGGNSALFTDRGHSFMKNRWVRLRKGDRTCYGQIQDAGPGEYNDAEYVFGHDDARPVNTRFNGAGLDVSPALNGCLGFERLEGLQDRVDWQFVEAEDVPDGPWSRLVTTSPVNW